MTPPDLDKGMKTIFICDLPSKDSRSGIVLNCDLNFNLELVVVESPDNMASIIIHPDDYGLKKLISFTKAFQEWVKLVSKATT